jgi:hypothetical protein
MRLTDYELELVLQALVIEIEKLKSLLATEPGKLKYMYEERLAALESAFKKLNE